MQEFGERAGKLGLADAGGAQAETLVEALSNAYLINPVLNAERANLRATDEQVAVAKSGLRAATAYVDVVRDQAVVPDQCRRANRAAPPDQGSLQHR